MLLLERFDRLDAPVRVNGDGPDNARSVDLGAVLGLPCAERLQRRQHVAPPFARTRHERVRRRLAPAKHGVRGIDLSDEPREAARFERTAQRIRALRHACEALRLVAAQRVAADPRRKQQRPEPVEIGIAMLRVKHERVALERGIAQTHADRVDPAAPALVRARLARAGLAEAELARKLEVMRSLLRDERQRIQPRNARRQQPLARAHLRLQALQRVFERGLRLAPAAGAHQREGMEHVADRAFQAQERAAHRHLVAAMQAQLGEPDAQRLRQRLRIGREPRQRPLADRQHILVPGDAQGSDCRVREVELPARRDTVEQGRGESRQERFPQDVAPLAAAREGGSHALDFFRWPARQQLEPNVRNEAVNVVRHPWVTGERSAPVDIFQRLAELGDGKFVEHLAIQAAAHVVAELMETVAPTHGDEHALRAEVAKRLPDVVLRDGATIATHAEPLRAACR